MIQQQIEFLRGFKIRLEQRGFNVDKCDDQIVANKYFRIYNSIPAACRFVWSWSYPENIHVDVQIGDYWVSRRFPTCLLMDYPGGFNDILTNAIRNTMRDIADEIASKMLPK